MFDISSRASRAIVASLIVLAPYVARAQTGEMPAGHPPIGESSQHGSGTMPTGHPPVEESSQHGGGTMPAMKVDPVAAMESFVREAKSLPSDRIETLAVSHNGRVKPLFSLARETNLFLVGGFSRWGLEPVQLYLGLVLFENSEHLRIINLRDPEVREKLGLSKAERFFSMAELQDSPLIQIAQPLAEKDSRSLTPQEKNLVEAYHQLWLARQMTSGSHFLETLDFNSSPGTHSAAPAPVVEKGKSLLRALASRDEAAVMATAEDLRFSSINQEMPALFKGQVGKMSLEVLYYKSHVFFFAALTFLALGGLLLFWRKAREFSVKTVLTMAMVPLVLSAGGFAVRVYLTGFAPVTNMYGTMLWVAFGVGAFSMILFQLYRNTVLTGLLWVGSGVILMLSENMPLVLSPDLDPIVAVLRSNLWLTTHVLTITISYAAFTIAMLIGNAALIRSIWKTDDVRFQKEYAHAAYRMIQLGIFLLSVGIILGGVWADYSWGRFWGWDPKETWALIADLGFLAILHAKYIGWVGPFGLLAASPVAYLLVIMAWYGVNFILATGLHSYGFSSGGTKAVVGFVIAQIVVIGIALVVRTWRRRGAALMKSASGSNQAAG